MKVAIVCGNPKAGSRTLAAARALSSRLADDADITVIELSDFAAELFDWTSERVAAAKRQVLASDVAVVASPTFKASYTGMLKAFLDHFEAGELRGIFAVPFMTIGSDKHYLAAETQLRPVLVELGATVATESCCISMAQLADLDEVVYGWLERNSHGVRIFAVMTTVEKH
ncbi:NADPH-dependent FMN reductase [Mycobacterium sp. GA-2829]|uniref:NADPH-dependent FMN reductase n=1 Tax=Mycobacterium sp. GA-2829 TaxID=1772283 RepID=UPI00073FFB53|nr:NAD(P)H-dependent oxidoreductase [Mycobacterium sp. GA-2829]KUI39266.1 hypothetical protein AU194_14665 [Mycobacterium sp. GA-2829]